MTGAAIGSKAGVNEYPGSCGLGRVPRSRPLDLHLVPGGADRDSRLPAAAPLHRSLTVGDPIGGTPADTDRRRRRRRTARREHLALGTRPVRIRAARGLRFTSGNAELWFESPAFRDDAQLPADALRGRSDEGLHRRRSERRLPAAGVRAGAAGGPQLLQPAPSHPGKSERVGGQSARRGNTEKL